jgi:hypothetical protein
MELACMACTVVCRNSAAGCLATALGNAVLVLALDPWLLLQKKLAA